MSQDVYAVFMLVLSALGCCWALVEFVKLEAAMMRDMLNHVTDAVAEHIIRKFKNEETI